MSGLRTAAAILTGSAVYAWSHTALLAPLASDGGTLVPALVIVGLAALGLLIGMIAGKIAPEQGRAAVYALAGLVALSALFDLLLSRTASAWSAIGTLTLTVPLILWAGAQASRS